MTDIKDSEIRFIGDEKPFDSRSELLKKTQLRDNSVLPSPTPHKSDYKSSPSKGSGCRWYVFILLAVLVVLGGIGLCAYRSCSSDEDDLLINSSGEDDVANAMFEPETVEVQFEAEPSKTQVGFIDSLLSVEETDVSYCLIRNETVNDIPFRIYLPLNAVPVFHVGKLDQKDKSIVLAMQAADIRKDNGKIVGACVYNGEVVSKGLAKKGYVAIINNRISVGVSEHSPLFEEAIEKNGDFFRQYPIVSEGKIVENNPKNISIRRAICERNGLCFITETLVPVSFHDFSQLLVDMDVQNAVYLVGSQYACGFCRDQNQELQAWGKVQYSHAKNISYLVWKTKVE